MFIKNSNDIEKPNNVLNIPLFKNKQFILTKWLFIRLFIVLILNIIYYSLEWKFFVKCLGNILALMFQSILGIETLFDYPNFTASLRGVVFLTKACLYFELYIYIFPFLYNSRKTILKNIVETFWGMVIIQTINILRIFTSVWWRISYDVPRWLYHDLPDTLIWYPICIGSMIYGAFKFHPVSIKIEKIKKDE